LLVLKESVAEKDRFIGSGVCAHSLKDRRFVEEGVKMAIFSKQRHNVDQGDEIHENAIIVRC
jgi:hypothetical protein